jgi:hypothetical protein
MEFGEASRGFDLGGVGLGEGGDGVVFLHDGASETEDEEPDNANQIDYDGGNCDPSVEAECYLNDDNSNEKHEDVPEDMVGKVDIIDDVGAHF